MVIAGAAGHAREIIDLLTIAEREQAYLFDNIRTDRPFTICNIQVISNVPLLEEQFAIDPRFILGTGSPESRRSLFDLFTNAGGIATTIIANTAFVSGIETNVGAGCNVMAFAFISNNVHIGTGTLVNTRANIHHDVEVGSFCEIGPGAVLLGNAEVGNETMIGAGAIVLPKVKIGAHVKIGAGSVVARNVPDGVTVKGVPAK
jgi:sugar O-acyltransferase (sialic acid O-acetyltransferase NeuD family)